MNIYDFDGTIFPGDCSIGFFFWCLKSHPKLWFSYTTLKVYTKSEMVSAVIPQLQWS